MEHRVLKELESKFFLQRIIKQYTYLAFNNPVGKLLPVNPINIRKRDYLLQRHLLEHVRRKTCTPPIDILFKGP